MIFLLPLPRFPISQIQSFHRLSENARYGFGYAVSLVNRYEAVITVLDVVEELSSFARSIVEEILGEKRWADRIKEKEADDHGGTVHTPTWKSHPTGRYNKQHR